MTVEANKTKWNLIRLRELNASRGACAIATPPWHCTCCWALRRTLLGVACVLHSRA